MGKFLRFNEPSSRVGPLHAPRNINHRLLSGKQIAKRTGKFLHKRIALFSLNKTNQTAPALAFPSSLPIDPEQDEILHSVFHRELNEEAMTDKSLMLHLSCDNAELTRRTWKESLRPEESHMMSLSPSQLHYQELIYEVFRTEEAYVNDLAIVYKIFARDALGWHGLPQAIRLIFESLAQIISMHRSLLHDLRRDQQEERPVIKSLVPCFSKYLEKFSQYATYFVHFEQANHDIASCMASKNSPLGMYFHLRTAWPECRRLTLQSFLLKPVQRLMKYPLFFKSLSECLDSRDPDAREHLSFLDQLDTVIRAIEEHKKAIEEHRKLEDLSSRIRGLNITLAKPERYLLYQGPLTILTSTSHAPFVKSAVSDTTGDADCEYIPYRNFGQKRNMGAFPMQNRKRVDAYVFLFSDLILCTAIRSKTAPVVEPLTSADFYGPERNTLFKLIHEPGQLTCIDSAIACEVKGAEGTMASLAQVRSSLRFGGLRKQRPEDELTKPSFKDEPNQFICSIVGRNISQLRFEARSEGEKQEWCQALELALEGHVRRQQSEEALTPNHNMSDSASSIPMSPLSPSSSASSPPPSSPSSSSVVYLKSDHNEPPQLHLLPFEELPMALARSTETMIPILPAIDTVLDDDETEKFNTAPQSLSSNSDDTSMDIDQDPHGLSSIQFSFPPNDAKPVSFGDFSHLTNDNHGDNGNVDGFAASARIFSEQLHDARGRRRMYVSRGEKLLRGLQGETDVSFAAPWPVRVSSIRDSPQKRDVTTAQVRP